MRRYPSLIPPLLFLLLFLLRAPLYLPAFLLRPIIFFTMDAATDPALLHRYLDKYPSLYLLAAGEIRPLDRKNFSSLDALRHYLNGLKQTERTVLRPYLPEIPSRVPALARAQLVLGGIPQGQDLEALKALQQKHRLPVRLEVRGEEYRPLFMGSSYSHHPEENRLSFELLFAPVVGRFREIRIANRQQHLSTLIPADLEWGTTLKLALNAAEDAMLVVELEGEGELISKTFQVKGIQQDQPSILMISHRSEASYLEHRFNLEKIPLQQALTKDLYQYPLLVFDGLPIRAIGPELSSVLTDLYRQKIASLLFISDGPEFGKSGDNPDLEAILPVHLVPRSLKYLPDMGILILLDVSSSMMGEKLSLAKVSTLELVKNLKRGDRVSLLTFWDKYRYLHGFKVQEEIQAEGDLAPLIARGGTDLYGALEDGMGRLIELQMPQKHIIILSDGNTKEVDFNRLIRQAQAEGISITAMAVGKEVNRPLLTRLAGKTGGHYYRIQSLEEIPSLIFEDRRDISRAAFGEDRFTIFDYQGEAVTGIGGMSLYAPKTDRQLIYQNQYQDPLFLMERRDRRPVLMFLSDIYGYYTEDFFARESIRHTVDALLRSLLDGQQFRFRIGEASGAVAFTLVDQKLLRPSLAIYQDNRLIREVPLKAGILGSYNAVIPLDARGEYLALLFNRGQLVSRIPFYFNGNLEGRDTDSYLAYEAFPALPLKRIPSPLLFLYLFFTSSVYVTYRWRRKR